LHRPVEDEVIDRFLERADPTTALYEAADPLEWPVLAGTCRSTAKLE
jgi:hypothetical protein